MSEPLTIELAKFLIARLKRSYKRHNALLKRG
jgi:hypothetical protein